MAEKHVLYEVESGVARITLNRPDKLNSFHAEMGRQMHEALSAAATDDAVRAVYLTGAGRGFCAGQDLAEATPEGDAEFDLGEIVRERYNPIVRGIRRLELPVVCGVNGVAAGAGANIALCCDIVIASERASFIQSFAKVGLIPDSGGTFFLPRLVGLARASAMAMLAEKIPASDAVACGMIYKAVPPEELEQTAFGLAAYLATQPTRGLALTKRALNASFGHTLDQQLELEIDLQAEAGATHDFSEGVAAFLEKRTPDFKGS